MEDEYMMDFIEISQFRSAPHNLFNKPFPNKSNPFKIGQVLEGINPKKTTSVFCMMTVVKIQGTNSRFNFNLDILLLYYKYLLILILTCSILF